MDSILDSKLFGALDDHVQCLHAMHKSVPDSDEKVSLNCSVVDPDPDPTF
jgi:hypothetical protein